MYKNYYGQLLKSYPENAEMLEWIKGVLDSRMYKYGKHMLIPYEARPFRSPKQILYSLYIKMCSKVTNYEGAVISIANANVGKFIQKEGYKVLLPPWYTGVLSKKSRNIIDNLVYEDFNKIITDDFKKRIYYLRDELRDFFQKNKTPFLLLTDDMIPIHRIAIDVCKDLGIPTGVFLHGLPGRYNSIDDSRADYLFVWGKKIKDLYIANGSKTNIVVTGHPSFSSYRVLNHNPQNVVVLGRSTVGAAVEDRGLSIQHVYAIESVLKNLGINRAILRLHPSENPKWYKKFIDNSFYSIDEQSLNTTIKNAKMVIGPISTVILDAVLNDIPFYPYIIDQESNPYAPIIVPPFSNMPEFPTAVTPEELQDNIYMGKCVTKDLFDGYVNPIFDIKKLTRCIGKE